MPSPSEHASPAEKIRSIRHKARTLSDDAGELLELYYRLGVVTVTEKASNAASITITASIVLLLSMFFLFFLGLGVGWYLGEMLDSFFAGFSIVAGVFFILIVITLSIRKSILFPLIRNLVVKKVYE